MKELMYVMKSIYQVTIDLEGELYPTMSLVNALFTGCVAALKVLADQPSASDTCRRVANGVSATLLKRWRGWSRDVRRLLDVATILDPRTKGMWFLQPEERERIWTTLTEEVTRSHHAKLFQDYRPFLCRNWEEEQKI